MVGKSNPLLARNTCSHKKGKEKNHFPFCYGLMHNLVDGNLFLNLKTISQ
jgi:hypothetical protein